MRNAFQLGKQIEKLDPTLKARWTRAQENRVQVDKLRRNGARTGPENRVDLHA